MLKYGRARVRSRLRPRRRRAIRQALGAKGLQIQQPTEIGRMLKNALEMQGPVLVTVPVDDRDNRRLMDVVHPGVLN